MSDQERNQPEPTALNYGPFVPDTSNPMRFSMAGDDCSLHFDLEALSPKQAEDHYSNQVLTGMLQLALLYIAKPTDHVCLYQEFNEAPWSDRLVTVFELFEASGLAHLPLSRVSFHPVDGFYESVAQTPVDTELENLYMISRSNRALQQDERLLAVSQNLNSKMHFAEHAPGFGLPVPDTVVTRKGQLDSRGVEQFLKQHTLPVMMKTLGLAGSRNVTTVESVDQAKSQLSEYDDSFGLILQQKLDTSVFQEMTVDLNVSFDEVQISNVRRLLFADGLWVGNELGRNVTVPEHLQPTLLRVGEYARDHGFASESGFNLGIDYFERRRGQENEARDIVITEINARWTGGLFPAELVKRLRLQDQQVYAFIEMCASDRFDAYLDFMRKHPVSRDGLQPFSVCPMGFAPFTLEMDSRAFVFTWQIVVGDFSAFEQAVSSELGADALPTATQINRSLSEG